MKTEIKLGRIYSIALKEVKHILRDPFTLVFAFGMPVLFLTFFGFIIDFNYKGLIMAYQDNDKSSASRNFAETFTSSGYFKFLPASLSGKVTDMLDSEKVAGVLIVEPGFGKKITNGENTDVQIIIDGADNSKSGVLMGYLTSIRGMSAAKLFKATVPGAVDIKTRFLFNPELNSRWFVIPALMVVIAGLLAVFLTALTVAREWENGSMELLLSTPVKPVEIVLGKLLPYIILTLISLVFVYLISRLVFGIPFVGNHLLYLIAFTVFVTAALSQGLLISVITRQQQLAMQFSFISSLLPSFLLSGFIFPIASMPVFFQYFTGILSPRWFIEISRGVYLKGSGITDLIKPFGALIIISVLLVFMAVKKFKTDLE